MKQDDAGSAPMLGSQGPVAWAWLTSDERQAIENAVAYWNTYHAPSIDTLRGLLSRCQRTALTDDEREALEYGIKQADEYDRLGLEDAKQAAIVFRGLLERLG